MKKAEKEKAGRKRDAKEVARRSTLINTDNIFIKLSESLLAPTPNPLAPPRSKPKRSPSRPASKQSPHKLSRSHLQPSKIHTDKSQLDMKGGADLGKSLNRSNVLGGEKVEAAGRSSAGGVSLRLDLSKFQHRKLAMSPPQGRLSREAFHWECVIGRGGYGRVWRVEVKKTQMHFAAKQMSKALILAKKNISSIINEKQLL